MKIAKTHYLIVDFEATCSDDGSVPRNEMEIIEIGAVLLNAQTLGIDDEFQTFVRPTRHPELTAFCTRLTTITQAQVDAAPEFIDALMHFTKWFKQHESLQFCSWGNYDRNQLQQDCDLHRIDYPFPEGHLDLKQAYSDAVGKSKRFAMNAALKQLNIGHEGTLHRGIDDARNTARIVRAVLTREDG